MDMGRSVTQQGWGPRTSISKIWYVTLTATGLDSAFNLSVSVSMLRCVEMSPSAMSHEEVGSRIQPVSSRGVGHILFIGFAGEHPGAFHGVYMS